MAKKAKESNSAKTKNKSTDVLSDDQIKKIVGEINKLAIDTVERGQMDIGDLVLSKVFQGSLDEATSKSPYKNKTMKSIIDHDNLRVNRRRLGEWVRAAFLRKQLLAKEVDCSNLSYSHFAVLLQVENEATRVKLANKANKKKASARKLADEVGKLHRVVHSEEDGKALLRLLGNPEALMKDEKAKKTLENQEDLEKLPFDIRMLIAKRAEEVAKHMIDSMNLLKVAKKNIALIELRETDVIDIEATNLVAVKA
ncbi:hypothetical protein [Desulfomonile tiedjei]|uniref:Uncharacterized protein n=1 Tax=Desulfomonile tiedjei (strain ATCC 49306 / DSM 6799 / DCB-1) TaxID=706587 RepID=I4C5N2_DESTA|nr:hypothetical protein [Desulfomonile tiedjei]AFM24873.1 hypothetical protein Desti_2179 [Desulfomonile tiedjei DSM 6799]